VLVGDGPLREQIQKQVDILGLSNNVVFAGIRSDIDKLLQAFDVFLMPSFHEGLPVTIVEAQAADLPCVLSSKITSEVKILKNLKFLDLDEEITTWKDTILNITKDHYRSNTRNEMVKAGYDARSSAETLTNYYMQ
jgi:glycosyltransferase involved in cell wall biosynthesis